MNRLRFGALLLTPDHHFGFYLSHRMVLTVPAPGIIRAAALHSFLPAKVFAVNGVALAFFEAMTAAMECHDSFACSFDMVKTMLHLPVDFSQNNFLQWMKGRYDAGLVDFTIPIPQSSEK